MYRERVTEITVLNPGKSDPKVFCRAEQQPEETDPPNSGIKKINALPKGTEKSIRKERSHPPKDHSARKSHALLMLFF